MSDDNAESTSGMQPAAQPDDAAAAGDVAASETATSEAVSDEAVGDKTETVTPAAQPAQAALTAQVSEPAAQHTNAPDAEPREGFHVEHVKVSEANEGQPWFEWIVAICLVVSILVAWSGHAGIGLLIVIAVSWITAAVRSILGPDSPWKVRSIGFDSFIGAMLGLGLGLLFWSIRFLH